MNRESGAAVKRQYSEKGGSMSSCRCIILNDVISPPLPHGLAALGGSFFFCCGFLNRCKMNIVRLTHSRIRRIRQLLMINWLFIAEPNRTFLSLCYTCIYIDNFDACSSRGRYVFYFIFFRMCPLRTELALPTELCKNSLKLLNNFLREILSAFSIAFYRFFEFPLIMQRKI